MRDNSFIYAYSFQLVIWQGTQGDIAHFGRWFMHAPQRTGERNLEPSLTVHQQATCGHTLEGSPGRPQQQLYYHTLK